MEAYYGPENFPDIDTPEFQAMLSELLFWDSLNSPGVWLNVATHEYAGRCDNLDELEKALWERSPRVGLRK